MSDTSKLATVHGSPGVAPRLAGLVRVLWPLWAGALAAGWLLHAAWPVGGLSSATAGLMLLALALVLALWLHWSRGRLASFLKGARGEETTARELSLLPAAYTVFHGLRLPGGDADHVVAGPSGVFVVETKNWSGRATVQEGRVLYEGREPDRPPLEQVRDTAAALRQDLEKAFSIPVPVQPVLCFAAGLDSATTKGAGGMIVCGVSALRGVLSENVEDSIPPALERRIVERLLALMGAAE